MHDPRETLKAVGLDGAPLGRPGSEPGLMVVFTGGQAAAIPLALDGGTLELGRDHPALAARPDHNVSRRHLAVRFDGRGLMVMDRGSRNGTSVDGVTLKPSTPREATRVIRIGDTLLIPVRDIGPRMLHGVRVTAGRVEGPAQHEALRLAMHAASVGRTLCITGESGTGKEAFARAFHAAGVPRAGSFQIVSGEVSPGMLLAAVAGTLFIEEVADLSLAAQGALLSLLDRGDAHPREAPAELRVCLATQRDLRAEVEGGRLREDLYFRIAAPRLVAPPLRDRPEEISWLVQLEVERAAPGLPAHASLVEACLTRRWPGNVRELLAEVRNAAFLALAERAPRVEACHVAPTAGAAICTRTEPQAAITLEPTSSTASWTQMRDRVASALERCEGNVSAASRELGVHRNQLRRWITRYRIDPRLFSHADPTNDP